MISPERSRSLAARRTDELDRRVEPDRRAFATTRLAGVSPTADAIESARRREATSARPRGIERRLEPDTVSSGGGIVRDAVAVEQQNLQFEQTVDKLIP